MKPNKKKPRIRNRPRNKANRLLASEGAQEELSLDQKNEGLQSHLSENDSEDDMPDLEDDTNTAQTKTVDEQPEENDALKTIQRLLRERILKNQQKPLETKAFKDIPTTPAPSSSERVDSPKKEVKVNASPSTPAPSTSKRVESPKKEVKVNAIPANQKSSKSKEKITENKTEKSAFIQNLQKKMEQMMANGDENLPNNLMENLKKLLDQTPMTDIESSDDEEEYLEYIYRPRKYFLVGLCNLCKCDLCKRAQLIECSKCHMTYYCSVQHMQNDVEHRQLCSGLQQVAGDVSGGHIFSKCADMSADQFRSYRIVTIRKVSGILQRPLTATEQEVILFPRLCMNGKCRKFEFADLKDCPKCGMVSFCSESHLVEEHEKWCSSYQLFKELIIFQEKFGRLDPSLPTKVLKETPLMCNDTKEIFKKLALDLPDNSCEYAALTQISTGPLTAHLALKLCEQLTHEDLTIHLIGAEIEFEVDVLHKWELFFLHITPAVKNLKVVFVGPELNPNNISFEQLKKTKCCKVCRKNQRTVNYFFEAKIYHDYCRSKTFVRPNLVCFFNAGLYRSTGYNMEDTWPETIGAASSLKVPIVVTAYTEYETPLDLERFVEECGRELKIVQNPAENPFSSVKPERNFISDDEAPLMFKNYFCFVVE